MIDLSKLSSRYRVRRMSDSDADDILGFCLQNAQYYQYCGRQADRDQVLGDLHIAPPGIGPSDKYYVGFYDGELLVAIMDLIDGYPGADTCYIGFFMMNARLQGRGIGSGIIRETCRYLKGAGFSTVCLAIDRDNPQSTHFWKKNGFQVVREVARDGGALLVAERAL